MKRPALIYFIVGHPLVLICNGLATVVSLYRFVDGQFSELAAVTFCVAMAYSCKAFGRVYDYRAWRREWDSVGGDAPPKRPVPWRTFRKVLGFIGLVAAFWYCYERHAEDLHATLLVFLVLWVIAASIYWLVHTVHRRRSAHNMEAGKHAVVTISVARPWIEASPLQVAYQRLPPHCHRALQASQGPKE